ncbi:hypothetical protein ACJIZ3_025836 [Penstemon smallii]|uniref:Uncharacterized protein n=1 Tax=Penstemon smallii TaxID=265156 RepID=A0ABD3TWP6_9LAMI
MPCRNNTGNKLQNLAAKLIDLLQNLSSNEFISDYIMNFLLPHLLISYASLCFNTQHDDLEVKLLEEMAALEAKYQKMYHGKISVRERFVASMVIPCT